MSTWLEDHLNEVIDRFADEDGTTPDVWRERAVYSVVARRATGDMESRGFEYFSDWMAAVGLGSPEAQT